MTMGGIFSDLPTLETEWLILRKMTMDDAADMFDYASDPEVARNLSWDVPRSIEATRVFLADIVDRYRAGRVAGWGIVHKQDNKLIGTCGFITLDPRHGRAEIGYALSRRYWNKGYMTEAVRKVISFGFLTMDLHRIQAMCDVPNIASARVMEKAGMKFEGILRGFMMREGLHRDVKMYSILRVDCGISAGQSN